MKKILLLASAFFIAHGLTVGSNPEGATFKITALLLGVFAYFIAGSVPGRWVRWVLYGTGAALTLAALITWPYVPDRNQTGSALAMAVPMLPPLMLGIFATGSRGAMFAAFAALMVKYGARVHVPAAVGLFFAAFVGAVIVRPDTVLERFEHWTMAWGYFVQRPFLGWGLGEFSKLGANSYGAHANGLLFTLLAETGAAGVVMVACVMFQAWRIAAPSHSPAKFGLLAFALHQLVDDTFFWPLTAVLVGVALAMVEDNQ